MKTPNTIENEIDQIRLGIYERAKGMTPTQLTEYYRRSTEATMKKFGLQFKLLENAWGTRTPRHQRDLEPSC